jgi:hypothetical protein
MTGKYQSRRALEDAWRARLQRAAAAHAEHARNLQDILAAFERGRHWTSPDEADVQSARQREADASTEYARVLKIFLALITEKKVPNEDPD